MHSLASLLLVLATVSAKIDRHAIVSQFNPSRNASSGQTPMQVGNGNFAFGADVTGLQTFLPFAVMSSWGWKNDSLPPGKTLADVENYRGIELDNHGHSVRYDYGGEPTIESWLISNPSRVNMGRVGLLFRNDDGQVLNITEANLTNIHQSLDLWTGIISSSFTYEGVSVNVTTVSAQAQDSIGITVSSTLVREGRLGIFVDFPWNDGKAKFKAPFVGDYSFPANHTTLLVRDGTIKHDQGSFSYLTTLTGDKSIITRDSPSAHRYTVLPARPGSDFAFVISFSVDGKERALKYRDVLASSKSVWTHYWTTSAFVDVLTGSEDPRATELQRRIILSRYLMRVNDAGDSPSQESGLVNNGWYGKFHMEMYFWHAAHMAIWNDWDLLRRSSDIYARFLPSALARAQVQQGWSSGARWPKMTDPSGRSTPGQINNLLIWQQPHPLIFALYEYRSFPTKATLRKWSAVVKETANWMSIFAWHNETSKYFDLGPPMHVVSEDTNYTVTRNPAFELAYWRLGLDIAETWMKNLGEPVPETWVTVKNALAPLPTDDDTYKVYEDIGLDFWTDPAYINDHPALVGLHGWLPPTPGLDLEIAKTTAEKVWRSWNLTNCWGWDFPMLAMSAARNGNPERAISFLLDPLFLFDDVGMPIGGVRVPTPYFPGSGALLYAVGLMAGGWDGSDGPAPGFPKTWKVRVEGMNKAL